MAKKSGEEHEEEGGEARTDRHRHRQAVRPARFEGQVQRVGRRRQVARVRPPEESQDQGEARTRRQGRPLGLYHHIP